MNFKTKTLTILIAAVLLISAISAVYAVDYSLTDAVIHLNVQEDGLLNVDEQITYYFQSSANGVYRDIPLKYGQSIENLEVYVDGAYATYKVYDNGNNQRIKVFLYKDAEHTKKISAGTTVKLILHYDMTKVVKIYNDVGELQYKVWGDEWEEDLESLKATITFPDDKKLEYWINPYLNNAESSWSGDTLTITSGGIDEGKYLEARAVIPLSEFDGEEKYAQHIDQDGLNEIRKTQNDHKNSQEALNTVGSIFNIFLIVLCAIPVAIYTRFGREPKIDYQAIYEHEPPTDDPPAFVNALMGGMGKDIGKLDQKAFQATIMDLIDRGKLGVSSEDDTEFTKSTFLTVESTEGLARYETELINILKRYELNGKISLSYMQDSLKSEYSARSFQESYDNWCEHFLRDYLPENKLRYYFDETGADYMNYFGIVAIILGILGAMFSFWFEYSGSFLTLIISVLFAVLGVGCLIMPSGIGGKYTDEGMLYAERWKKFKKFLEDYSLIKEHPPESIAIWNRYLVYATALGVADEVYKAMKLHLYSGSDYYYHDNHVYMFYYLGGYHYINNSFSTASSTISAADNSSVGGVGGGSGGGGGGAF